MFQRTKITPECELILGIKLDKDCFSVAKTIVSNALAAGKYRFSGCFVTLHAIETTKTSFLSHWRC